MATKQKTLEDMVRSLVGSEQNLRQAYVNINAMLSLGGAPIALLNEYNADVTKLNVTTREFVQLLVSMGQPPAGGKTDPQSLPRFVFTPPADGTPYILTSQIKVVGQLGPEPTAGQAPGVGFFWVLGALVIAIGGYGIIKAWNAPAVEAQKTKQLELKTQAEMFKMLSGKMTEVMSICIGGVQPTPDKVNQCLMQASTAMSQIKAGLPSSLTGKSGWGFLEVIGVLAAGGIAIVGGLWVYKKITEIKGDRYLPPRGGGSPVYARAIGPSRQLPAHEYTGRFEGPEDDYDD